MTEKEILLNGLTHYLGDCEKCDSCPYHYNPECVKDMVKDCVDYLLGSEKSEPAPPDVLPCIAYTPPDLRPCLANGKKGWFHCWEYVQKGNDFLKGGISGQISYVVGLVELEDGQCKEFNPEQIKFTDRSAEK